MLNCYSDGEVSGQNSTVLAVKRRGLLADRNSFLNTTAHPLRVPFRSKLKATDLMDCNPLFALCRFTTTSNEPEPESPFILEALAM
jgi:hypothetical protein